MSLQSRKEHRPYLELRPIKYQLNPFGYADGSVLWQQGNTKVWACVSLHDGVPRFMKQNKEKGGWLNAEYAMLPCSTNQGRINRDSFNNINYRSVEIGRLIGRVFRTVVDIKAFGEKTIHIDCEVLQADGGTRVACISAASIALKEAEKVWMAKGLIRRPIIRNRLAAVSVGLVEGRVLLDLDQTEDSSADADFNFVLTDHDMVVEMQGSAEKYPLAWVHLEELQKAASLGAKAIFAMLAAQQS